MTPARFRLSVFGAFLGLLSVPPASAILFPYTQRTRAYSGYQPTVRGDNEMIGMAGATVAIPNSVGALEMNPAGLTMTMGNVTAQINSNEVKDREVTGSERETVRSTQWGLTAAPNEWGFAIAYYSPSFEGGAYTSPNTSLTRDYEVSVKELRLSASRSLMKKRLSLGAALEFAHAIRSIDSAHENSNALSFQLGAIYHWKKHILFGLSYSPPLEIGGPHPSYGAPDLPGFGQPIRMPMLLTAGAGWIPNRFFSLGASITAVGTTENTALLRDQSVTVGESFTLQPRAGASYILAQYTNLKVAVAAGTYYESSRTEGRSSRLHGTFSFQVNPYFINTGFGVDRAERYNNVFFSLGFDIVRTARLFGIIPKDPVPAYRGFFPPPTKIMPDGLSDGLTIGERKQHEAPSVSDVKQIIENIPTNIENKLKGLPMVEPTPTPKSPSKSKRKKPVRRKSRSR